MKSKILSTEMQKRMRVCAFAICVAVCVCFRDEQFSLRLGHTRVLTSHCDVIHYARVASLPVPYKICAPIGREI